MNINVLFRIVMGDFTAHGEKDKGKTKGTASQSVSLKRAS